MSDDLDPVGPAGLPPDGAAAHVVVAGVDPLVVDREVEHHLARVRRLRPDERFTATDGAGAWRWCRWQPAGAVASGPVHHVDRADPQITVAFALTKGNKPETVVQKLAELGVDRIVPFRAGRSIVRWDEEKAVAAVERWRAIARAAVAQSGQVWVPDVTSVTDIDGIVTLGARRLDRGGRWPSLAHSVVAIGPEGGWTPEEADKLPAVTTLGGTVLRAETAAITAGAVLTSMRVGIVRPAAETGH